MATCGNCKQEGQTVEHIKGCYAAHRGTTITAEVGPITQQYVESRDFRPMALTLPDSKYALLDGQGGITFYEVRTGKKGKWTGFQFLDRLVGHPGDWMRYPVKGAAKAQVLDAISVDPKAAAICFSKHFTVCAVCGSPLSDPESMAAGLGPVCATRF